MPVPATIDDLSTTAGSNSPTGGETPKDGDNYIRSLSAFIAALRDKLNGTSAATLDDATLSGTLTLSTTNLTSGTYTPTLTSVSNISASSVISTAQYLRVGNTVTVSGALNITPTNSVSTTSLAISLPIASSLTGSAMAGGSAVLNSPTGTIQYAAPIFADTSTADRVKLAFASGTGHGVSGAWWYQFTYRVV